MATDTKRRLITSFHNLTAEQQEEVKALYPLGFSEVMTRYDKPDGSFFYTVPYETDDTYYMVKIDVKVDDGQDDDSDAYYDEDDLKGADEFADAPSDDPADDDFYRVVTRGRASAKPSKKYRDFPLAESP